LIVAESGPVKSEDEGRRLLIFEFIKERVRNVQPLVVDTRLVCPALSNLTGPEIKATLISGGLMILFLYLGEPLLHVLGLETHSFAVAGSIVIFILGLEMILGIEFFKSDKEAKSNMMVPIAFPLIAGSGTLTTIISLKANYEESILLIAILINLVIVFIVLKSLDLIERILGPGGMVAIRKFFGVILLAIAIKIFSSNVPGLIK
jgi:multiple antibiotic resistance protein